MRDYHLHRDPCYCKIHTFSACVFSADGATRMNSYTLWLDPMNPLDIFRDIPTSRVEYRALRVCFLRFG